MLVQLPNLAATAAAARALALVLASAARPVVVGLDGHLGAGKTTFLREMAHALGVRGPVTSPTFTLERRYPLPGGGLLRHWDFYRLDEHSDLEELGFWDRGPGDIIAVEWWDRFADRLDSREPLLLKLSFRAPDLAQNPDTREMTILPGHTEASRALATLYGPSLRS